MLIKHLKGYKRSDLVSLSDNLKQAKPDYLIVLVGEENGGVPVLVVASEEAIKRGYKAGDLVKKIANELGGSGGGRPDSASGAGKSLARLNEAFINFKGSIK